MGDPFAPSAAATAEDSLLRRIADVERRTLALETPSGFEAEIRAAVARLEYAIPKTWFPVEAQS